MQKLKLVDISKTYKNGEVVTALKGISLAFRQNEFVAILGPSGCGKTTLLNTIGGLDQYDSGDLIINGVSTKKYKDSDWDAYRNRSIGFVFQSYNLIAHQSVLQNVEISMTLSGVSPAERKRRAKEALSDVGLSGQQHKKPNQLSGGQMQRVAIARALVNNPDIILADEPTGALDSQTSLQIMEILKKISKSRLVIMVTHNSEIAEKYASRIIRLLDGEVQTDSNPVGNDETSPNAPKSEKKEKMTAMTMATATSLSFRNLLTKKGRTIITAFAGSIGIIGVALVLALSGGLSAYMGEMQTDTLSGFPITIGTSPQSIDQIPGPMMMRGNEEVVTLTAHADSDDVYRYDRNANQRTHTNVFTEDYLDYLGKLETALPGSVSTISYTRGVNMNVLAKTGDAVVKYETTEQSSFGMGAMGGMASMGSAFGVGSNLYWQEMPDNEDFIRSQYDLIGAGSRLPQAANEVAIVVDEYNRLDTAFLDKLGFTDEASTITLSDFLGKTFLKVIANNDFYTQNGEVFSTANGTEYEALYASDSGLELTIVGVLRIKEDAASGYFSQGLIYTAALTDYVTENAHGSQIAKAQQASEKDILTGAPFANETAKNSRLLSLGAETVPTGASIYPVDFASKDRIKTYLDDYNAGKADENQVLYSDMAETITQTTSSLLDTVSLVLIAFAAISLIVSTIMIAIITYVSVIERTKEIGVLRSVGARKKDISRVFNAETLIIGFVAGVLGVSLTYLLSLPINAIIENLAGISGIATLSPLYAVLLIVGSMVLTLIAGFIPSRMAANKDPVEALRTE